MVSGGRRRYRPRGLLLGRKVRSNGKKKKFMLLNIIMETLTRREQTFQDRNKNTREGDKIGSETGVKNRSFKLVRHILS